MNRALLNTAWISSGLMMPIVQVTTMRTMTTDTWSRYGRNSGTIRPVLLRPVRPRPARAGVFVTMRRLLLGTTRPATSDVPSCSHGTENSTFWPGQGFHEMQNAADHVDHYAHLLRRLHDNELGQGWRRESRQDVRR